MNSFTLRYLMGVLLVSALVGSVAVASVVGSLLDGTWAVHGPWRLLAWWQVHRSTRPGPFAAGVVVTLVVIALAGLVFRVGLAIHTPKVPEAGTDKWGGLATLEAAGLAQDAGVVVGRWGSAIPRKPTHGLLAYDGPEHQLVAGGTRSGKGAGHVIPTLLNWRSSVVAYDIKGELWEHTAGFRSRFTHALRFAPTRSGSARYNPLLEIRREHAVRDAQNLAAILVDPGGEKKSLDIWDQQAAQFLTATILHVLFTAPDGQKHLGRVRELVMEFETTVDLMQRTCHVIDEDGEAMAHEEIARAAKSLQEQGERFRSSVKGTVEGYLILWADPEVVRATAESDFSASDLMCVDSPVSLYIEPPPSDADRLRPLIRAVLYQLSRTLMQELETDNRGRKKHHQLLLLLDEFPTLGKLPFFSDNLRQMAGYGLKAHLVVQSFADIAEAYGPHNSIIDNCHVVVAFAAADPSTAKRVSEMTGQVVELRRSFSGRRLAPLDVKSRTSSQSEQVRPLLHPGEVRELDQEDQLVFVTGHPPLRTRKIRYWKDPVFGPRLIPPPGPDDPTDLPPDSVVSLDWTGVRALDVLPPEDPDAEAWDDTGGGGGVTYVEPATVSPAPRSVGTSSSRTAVRQSDTRPGPLTIDDIDAILGPGKPAPTPTASPPVPPVPRQSRRFPWTHRPLPTTKGSTCNARQNSPPRRGYQEVAAGHRPPGPRGLPGARRPGRRQGDPQHPD